MTNPQALNRYTYTYNNPLKYTDPDGHHPCLAALAGGPAVAGGCAAVVALGALAVYAYYKVVDATMANQQAGNGKTPAIPDTGGQTASPNPPSDPNDLNDLVRNQGKVEIREKTQQGTGKGTAYESFLKDKLGASRGFESRITGRGQYRDFDGSYNNGRTWFEAKDQTWTDKAISNFYSQAGEQIKIAEAAGSRYQLISRQAIPEEIKRWLLNRGATFEEIPMP
jgi:hypothetical protein